LTQNVKVEPGSHLDLNLELLFGYHASRVSVGGNIIARQEEELDFKNNLATQTYGVVTPGTSSAVNFDLSTNVGLGNYTTYALSNDNIDLKAAQAPGIFAYKVYLQYAYDYVKRNTERMFTVATGVSLNITDQNAHFDGIGCWFKMAAYF
jgi:outer membrane protein assembly factor BamA